jgi:ParB-like chromosome segregation protein Spo0J
MAVRSERSAAPGAPVLASAPALVPVGLLAIGDSPRLEGEDPAHVRRLASSSRALPPILVHRATMRVVDGMHRLAAARLRGARAVEVEFFEGAAEDVFALSVQLNLQGGLPLSRPDRMAAARRLLSARPYWSNRRIAVTTGLAPSTVASLRRRSAQDDGQSYPWRVGRDGRARPLYAAEGRLRASRVIAQDPAVSLREIAVRADISVSTAKDVRDRMRRGEDPVPPGLKDSARTPPETALGAPDAPRRASAPDAPQVPGVDRPAPARPDLAGMAQDPSLRTDAGRFLLRLLFAHEMGDEERWARLARSVPWHREEMLAQAARRCADRWLRFADELEPRCRQGGQVQSPPGS